MKKRVKVASIGATVGLALLLMAAASCDHVQAAAQAANKYDNALKAFVHSEIVLHDQGKISDATHVEMLNAEKLGSKAGHDIDSALLLAAKGSDASSYIDLAEQDFDAFAMAVAKDPATKDALTSAANVVGDALKNTLSLIKQIKTTSQNRSPSKLPFAMLLPLMGFAAVGGAVAGVAKVAQLLTLITSLEPVAFDAILAFATSLKGKTTEEIVAMNESILSDVDTTIQQQLDLQKPSQSS